MSEFNRRVQFVIPQTGGLRRDGGQVNVEQIAADATGYRDQRTRQGIAVFARFDYDSLRAPPQSPNPSGVGSYAGVQSTLALPQGTLANRVYLHVPSEDQTGRQYNHGPLLGPTGTHPIVSLFFPILEAWVFADTRGDASFGGGDLDAERVVAIDGASSYVGTFAVDWSDGLQARMLFINASVRDAWLSYLQRTTRYWLAWAAVEDQGVGTELVTVGDSLPIAERRVSLRVRYDARIGVGRQLVFDGATYTILSIQEQPDRRRTLVLDCSTSGLANL